MGVRPKQRREDGPVRERAADAAGPNRQRAPAAADVPESLRPVPPNQPNLNNPRRARTFGPALTYLKQNPIIYSFFIGQSCANVMRITYRS